MLIEAEYEQIDRFRLPRIAIAMLAAMFGMFLPIFSSPLVSGGAVNVIWGSLYGLGFALLHSLFHDYHSGLLGFSYAVAGFIVWPVVLTLLLIKLLRLFELRLSGIYRVAIGVLIVACFVINIPIERVQGSYADGLPIFTKYIDF